jgi:hypothetical protein
MSRSAPSQGRDDWRRMGLERYEFEWRLIET